MTIRVVAKLIVPPANRVAFKAVLDRIIHKIRTDEADHTLVFEYNSLDPDGLTFLVHEVYPDADAYRAHVRSMRELSPEIMRLCSVEWAAITGPLPDEVAAKLKATTTMTYYGHRYASIEDVPLK